LGIGAGYLLQSKAAKEMSPDQKASIGSIAGVAAVLVPTIYYKNLGLGWKQARAYAQALSTGTLHELPKITIPTKLGPFKFKK
jgi:hypothetical protein